MGIISNSEKKHVNYDELFWCNASILQRQSNQVCSDLCKQYGVSAKIKYEEPSDTHGSVKDVFPEACAVHLASSVLTQNVTKFFRSVGGHEVVDNVVTLCHELEHVRQFKQAHDPNGNSYYAKRYCLDTRNPIFYRFSQDRYHENRSELEAELNGISEGAKQLHNMFSDKGMTDEMCEAAVVDYVNRKCFVDVDAKILEPKAYYVHPDTLYENLSDIKADFEAVIHSDRKIS